MSLTDRHNAPAPYWSLAGFWLGAQLTVPALPSVIVFGAAFGTVAAQKGMTFVEALLMTTFVFGGVSQFVAMEIWTTPLTLGAIVTLVLVTALVNLRFLLMSASLRPALGGVPGWQIYPPLLLMTDTTWLIASRYHAEGGSEASVLLGSGIAVWLPWVAASVVGYLVGALVHDPRALGLDLVMPIFFSCLLVPIWPGRRRAIPWLIAGVVSLAVETTVPGWWFVVIGALAGAIAGGFVHDRQ